MYRDSLNLDFDKNVVKFIEYFSNSTKSVRNPKKGTILLINPTFKPN